MFQGFGDQNSIKFPDAVAENVGTSQKNNLRVLQGQRSIKKNLTILKKASILENIVTGREKSCLLLKKYFIAK